MPARTNPRTERKVIKPFIGMLTDKESSVNRRPGHFDVLDNCYSNVDEIKKRKGFGEYVNTHTTGSRVYGQHRQSEAGTEFQNVKIISGASNLYFYDGSGAAWVQFTGHTFPLSDTDFVEMDGFDEWNGVYNVVEAVKTGSTSTDVLLNLGTGPWADNFLVGTVVRFTHSASNVEYKIIAGNFYDGADDHIIFNDDDPLSLTPAAGTAMLIREQGNMMYIGGGGEYGVIGPEETISGIGGGTSAIGYRQLDGTAYSHDGFTGIESHANRIFGWRNRRLYFSDLFNGHNFGKNSYFDFPTSVRKVREFSDDIAIIYEARRVWALIGVSPSNWELRIVTEEVGCSLQKTVANYSSTAFTMQMFVASDNSVRAITSDTFKQIRRETRLQSLTQDYIHDEFSAISNVLCAGVDDEGKYTIFKSTGDFYTLNVRGSERMRFREWAWSKGDTPRIFYNADLIAGFLRVGDSANGQIYTWNNTNGDNGADIAQTIRRRGMNFDALGDKTKFKHLSIAQGAHDDSTTVTVKAEANDSGSAGTIDHTLGTHDPSTGDKHREYKIPNNPSNSEGSGQMLDYEITETSNDEIAPIEEISFRYKPSLLK